MHIHGVLLAAGSSQRFGSIKQLAEINGVPMIIGAVKQFENSLLDSFTIALGANSDILSKVLKEYPYCVVQNWQNGMGHTISEMIDIVPSRATHILFCLADQVAITSYHLDQLIKTAKEHPNLIASANYRGVFGVPAVFPIAYAQHLKNLKGGQGAKHLIKKHHTECIHIDLPEAGKDIDTKEQLQHWLNHSNC